MRAKNPIINAHRRYMREREKERREIETKFLPTQPLSMSEYCPVKRPFGVRELIEDAVRIEDLYNHPPKRTEVPKDMTYPSTLDFKPASKRAFFKEIVTMFTF